MFVLTISHAVADYDKWKAVYDQFPPTTRGAKLARVNRRVDDPSMVTVVAGFESLDTLNGFLAAPELKAKMMEAGVIGEPRIEIYEQVDAIQV